MTSLPIQKIVSGGQTGVDQAALDVAISLEIPHGGWCPKGRLCESGVIPATYQLRENDSANYAHRTERNVIESDATLILYWEQISGGTKLTKRLAAKHHRPTKLIDLSTNADSKQVQDWLIEKNIGVLNVAGPRASSHPRLARLAEAFLTLVFDPHS